MMGWGGEAPPHHPASDRNRPNRKVFRYPEIIFSHRGGGCIIRRTKPECSMRKPITMSVLLGALLGIGPIQAQTAPAPAPARTSGLERRFDPLLDPAEMTGWMRTMTAEPNQVGSPHDRANADTVLSLFRDWG